MEALDTIVYILFGAVLLSAGIATLYITRAWNVRPVLKEFLSEMRTLNSNVDLILNFMSSETDSSSDKKKAVHSICRNCAHRTTFYEINAQDIFNYKCKRDMRTISLQDTCKRFEPDLQNSNK